MHHHVLRLVALLVAGFSVGSAFNTEPGRLGCYDYSIIRIWHLSINTHEQNNVQSCMNVCQGFKYAGVQAGNRCMCGNNILPTTLPDSWCDFPCFGDPSQTCGGRQALEVFPVQPKPALIGKPKGCFQDPGDRVWKTGLIFLQGNSRQRCFNSCRGFRYAGLENGVWCICGDTLPQTATLPSSSCQTPCQGNGSQTCGGIWALHVFEIREAQDRNPPSALGPVQMRGRGYQPRGDLGTYKLFTQRKTWEDALQQCEDDDAHLLIINSEREAEFVRSLFAQVPSERHMHAGFSDLLRKGSYRTIFGETLESTGYNLWSSHHPKVASSVKHCGSVGFQGRLAQIDGNCKAHAMFVCEKNSRVSFTQFGHTFL